MSLVRLVVAAVSQQYLVIILNVQANPPPPSPKPCEAVLLRMRILYFTSSELNPGNIRLPPLKGLEGPGQFLI